MREQVKQRDERLAAPERAGRCGALARDAAGDGMRRCSRASGCARSTAARSSTPRPTSCSRRSTRSRPRRSWCSPNSPNVVMAAERAAALSDKTVARRPVALAPGRARGGGQPRPGAQRRGERDGDDQGRSSASAPAPSRRPPATTRRAASAKATRSASSTTRSSSGAGRGRRCAACSSGSREDAELITCLRGADAPLDDEHRAGAGRRRGRVRALRRRPAELLVAAVG